MGEFVPFKNLNIYTIKINDSNKKYLGSLTISEDFERKEVEDPNAAGPSPGNIKIVDIPKGYSVALSENFVDPKNNVKNFAQNLEKNHGLSIGGDVLKFKTPDFEKTIVGEFQKRFGFEATLHKTE